MDLPFYNFHTNGTVYTIAFVSSFFHRITGETDLTQNIHIHKIYNIGLQWPPAESDKGEHKRSVCILKIRRIQPKAWSSPVSRVSPCQDVDGSVLEAGTLSEVKVKGKPGAPLKKQKSAFLLHFPSFALFRQ